MGKIVHRDQSCKKCGSSDARQVYETLDSYCFSCSTWFPPDKQETFTNNKNYENKQLMDLDEIHGFDIRGFKERAITKHISEFFGVRVSYNDKGEIDTHYYPYGPNEIIGYKVRKLPKEFTCIGKVNDLFGRRLFNSGRQLVITEGELDTLSVAQAWYDKYQTVYPVVSLPSASSTKLLLDHRDWIRSFDKVVLWLDQDEPGQQATEKAAKIIGFDKVHIVKSKHKDASDVLVKEGWKAVISAIYDASPWSPAGIVQSADTWELYKKELDADYVPWASFAVDLNKLSYGRRMGSITMITSGTGMGKSSFLKEDQYHLLLNTESKIGICSLEESIYEAVGGIMALHANKRLHLPDTQISEEEEKQLWQDTMGTNRFMFLDHQGSVSDDSLIDKIEFMALSGCKFIYLDHITIAVSEIDGSDINTAIDRLMSDLLKIVKRYNIWLGVVSHLRKTNNNQRSFEEGAVPSDDDLKGSGSLKQIPAQILAISRNKTEEDPIKRHTSKLWILKDRYTGRTGPAGTYLFNELTGRLQSTDHFVVEL